MSESEIKDTQPNRAAEETQPTAVNPETQPNLLKSKPKKFSRWLAGLVVLLLILLGLLAGYGSGMGQRVDAKKTQVTSQLQEQFDLGIQKMELGQYDLAKVHFDFIIENDPNFPGVLEAYTDLLLRMQTSPTPTYTPTPTISPTPDLRGVEAIYANVRAALTDRDWDTVLTNLDSLRKADPSYRTAEVEGMYYLALRMRGVGKIVLQDGEICPDINLEGGIYDLTLAERFGTLDAIAESLRNYSRLYIIGASYWDQDWEQAQAIFDQVRAGNPNLRDTSCMTATERWRYATIKRAEQLMASDDPCGAEEQFNLAFSVTSDKNSDYYPTATKNFIECHGSDNGGGEIQPSQEGPTETPTLTPTPAPTPTP
jgi:tetratricopeptide (TPR) repeat protein